MLEEVKSYLHITWNEEDATVLIPMINRGKAYLNDIADCELVYEDDYQAKQLLLDYCRYVRNNTFEMFEVNFKRELLKLSIREGVKKHVSSTTTTTT